MASSVVADEGPAMPQVRFLENRFGLTPAQARLVVHLVAGHSLRCSAEALGISYQTARGHLRAVFEKTGTHRQAELVLTVFQAMTDPNAPAVPAGTAGQEDAHGRAAGKKYQEVSPARAMWKQNRHAQLRSRKRAPSSVMRTKTPLTDAVQSTSQGEKECWRSSNDIAKH
jgi:DNA-binding CsgD family transcriptional regulator